MLNVVEVWRFHCKMLFHIVCCFGRRRQAWKSNIQMIYDVLVRNWKSIFPFLLARGRPKMSENIHDLSRAKLRSIFGMQTFHSPSISVLCPNIAHPNLNKSYFSLIGLIYLILSSSSKKFLMLTPLGVAFDNPSAALAQMKRAAMAPNTITRFRMMARTVLGLTELDRLFCIS